MSMITATAWVPRGHAAQFPKKYELSEAEYERIAELAKLQLDDAKGDLEDAKTEKVAGESDDDDSDEKDTKKKDKKDKKKKRVQSKE
jgi:periodic tryptophan protein 1